MKVCRSTHSAIARWSAPERRLADRSAFTLAELLIATGVFSIIMALTLSAFIGTLKLGYHAEATIESSTKLRNATDMIARAVRSAAGPAVVSTDGLQLTVPGHELAIGIIVDGTNIGPANEGKGWKDNQQVIKVADYTVAAATHSIFRSSLRPTGAVAAGDIGTYFKSTDDLADAVETVIDMDFMFKEGDAVVIPATAYGDSVTRIIKSRSNGKKQKTITFEDKLGVDVPEGTHIKGTSGRRMRFEVVPESHPKPSERGDLRYYPDILNQPNQFRVLAKGIDPSPPSDPATPSSAVSTPFSQASRYLTLNLQHVPKGTPAGRTIQGVLTTVYVRTDSSLP